MLLISLKNLLSGFHSNIHENILALLPPIVNHLVSMTGYRAQL